MNATRTWLAVAINIMPIPDSERAIVTREKAHDYLLNTEHPDGGSKAIWLGSLGYKHGYWQVLAHDLLKIARTCDDFTIETSPIGVKYKCRGEIGQPGSPGSCISSVDRRAWRSTSFGYSISG